jgi:hypothetical protein
MRSTVGARKERQMSKIKQALVAQCGMSEAQAAAEAANCAKTAKALRVSIYAVAVQVWGVAL